MPDVDPEDARRSARLFPALFWAGVGLAPLAALLILLGSSGGAVRFGAVLGVLAPVLIGLSIALRPDPDTVRLQIEEALLEEIDALRSEMRRDLAATDRSTHQLLGERLGALQQAVDSLRAGRAAPPPVTMPTPAPAPAPMAARGAAAAPPVAATAAAYPVARPRSIAPPPAAATPRSATPYSATPYSAAPNGAAPRSAAPQSAHPYPAAPQPAPTGRRAAPPVSAPGVPASNGRAAAPIGGAGRRAGGRSARHQADGYQQPAGGRAAAAPPSGGVYRHTDTVPATPRPPYADEPRTNGNGRRSRADRRYDDQDRRYDDQGWAPPAPRGANPPPPPPPPPAPPPQGRRSAEPYQESWTDQKLRERYGDRRPRPSYDRDDGDSWRRGDTGQWRRPISGEPISGEPISAEPISRGRRRRWEEDSSVDLRRDDLLDTGSSERTRWPSRPGDDPGREPRYETRWSPTGREPNGNGVNGHGTNGANGANGHRRPDYSRDLPDYSRRALPPASSEPSWNDSWEEPPREARSHRYRPDFELTDERWR
jgi:hypothetical protein